MGGLTWAGVREGLASGPPPSGRDVRDADTRKLGASARPAVAAARTSMAEIKDYATDCTKMVDADAARRQNH
jgi:hypothetical protein